MNGALLAIVVMLASEGQFSHFVYNGGPGTRLSTSQFVTDTAIIRFLPNAIAGADECTGAALSTTKGPLVHVRSGSAYCNKSDGTLVALGTDTPRLTANGLLSEQASTNRVIRNREFDNVAWTCTDVTVTANTENGPNGSLQADTLTSTANGAYCESTAFVGTSSNFSNSIYAKTTAGTQDMQMILRDTTAGADRCTSSHTATTSWQRFRCLKTSGVTGANNHVLRVYPSAASTGTIVVWGAQAEAYGVNQTNMTSVIDTDGAAATRNGDSPRVDLASGNHFSSTSYFKAIIFMPYGGTQGYTFYSNSGTPTNTVTILSSSGPVMQCAFQDGSTNPTVNSTAVLNYGAENTVSCQYGASQITACVNGVCNTVATAAFNPGAVSYSQFGIARGTGAANALKGAIRNLCVSNTAADCP